MWFRLLPIVWVLFCTTSKPVVEDQIRAQQTDVTLEKSVIHIWVSSSYFLFDNNLGPVYFNVFFQAPVPTFIHHI